MKFKKNSAKKIVLHDAQNFFRRRFSISLILFIFAMLAGLICGSAKHAFAEASCPAGQEKSAGLCYKKCPAGFQGDGPTCWRACPQGYKSKEGTCRKLGAMLPRTLYSRGEGRATTLLCSPMEQKEGQRCYPRCKSGYDGIGPNCFSPCPEDYEAVGAQCGEVVDILIQENQYRGVGKIPQ